VDSWTVNVQYRFKGGSDGANPAAGVIIGTDGALCGTTLAGGSSGFGTVFRLIPPGSPGSSWTERILYSFGGGSDGVGPSAPLVSSGGALYGTTFSGGTGNDGTVFSLTAPRSPDGAWTEALLHSFSGYPNDGANLFAGLAVGSHGVMYGTTYFGGSAPCFGNGCGTVFSLTPPASRGGARTEDVLYNFTGEAMDLVPMWV
jgi:uncharacterized repeat protein (TIGR03803 family)